MIQKLAPFVVRRVSCVPRMQGLSRPLRHSREIKESPVDEDVQQGQFASSA